MKTTKLRVLVVLAAVAAASVVGVATAAPPDQAQDEHARIVEFWTHARVAQAVPRDFVLDANGALVPRGKPAGTPGNGPGGGGGEEDPPADPAVVTGASWGGDNNVDATTGKVLFALGSSYYVCSASVVADNSVVDGDSLILTAAHCVFGSDFATNWVFIPDYDSAPAPLSSSSDAYCDDTVYGCWGATALAAHYGFTSEGGFNLTAAEFDYGVAKVGIGGQTGDELVLDSMLAGLGLVIPTINAATLIDGDASAFGYPAAKKYKGSDLVYCAGPVGTDGNTGGATYRLLCDMTGGSSGGPWFSPFDTGAGTGTLTSVNSYGYRGGDSMYGPKFSGLTADVLAAADAATPATPANGVVVGAP